MTSPSSSTARARKSPDCRSAVCRVRSRRWESACVAVALRPVEVATDARLGFDREPRVGVGHPVRPQYESRGADDRCGHRSRRGMRRGTGGDDAVPVNIMVRPLLSCRRPIHRRTPNPAGIEVAAMRRLWDRPAYEKARRFGGPRYRSPVSVVVVGSANLDLVYRVERIPAAGETVLATGVDSAPGGKGNNQVIAAARAGAEHPSSLPSVRIRPATVLSRVSCRVASTFTCGEWMRPPARPSSTWTTGPRIRSSSPRARIGCSRT